MNARTKIFYAGLSMLGVILAGCGGKNTSTGDLLSGSTLPALSVSSVSARNLTTLDIEFNDALEPVSAATLSNYAIKNNAGVAVNISAVHVDAANNKKVNLTTAYLNETVAYSLTVYNVSGTGATRPIPVAGVSTSFTGLGSNSPQFGIQSVATLDAFHVRVQFNYNVDPVSGTTLSNYGITSVSNGTPVNVTAAVINALNAATVDLTTGDLTVFTQYTLKVTNVSTTATALPISSTGISLVFSGVAGSLADSTPPNILSPANGSVTGLSVALVWTSKSGATSYTVDVATDAGFTLPITGSPFTVTAPSTTYSLTLATGNRYYWRVRANTTALGQYGSGSFDALDAAIYVYCASGTTCSDTGAIGHQSAPFQTIMGGAAEAARLGKKTVKVASRGGLSAYAETLILRDGVSLSGGYNAATWIQDKVNNRTAVSSAITYVVYGQNIAMNTVVEGFNFQNISTGQINSYGMKLDNCLNQLTIQDNTINSGTGTTTSAAIYNNGSFPNILGNTMNAGGGGTSYGVYNNIGSITTLSNNTINGGSGTTSYGIFNNDTITTMSGNAVNGGSGTGNTYGVFNGGSITTFSNNSITGGSGSTASYGAYLPAASSIATLTNNTLNGGSGANSYGVYTASTTALVFSNNTIHGGSGSASSRGIYNAAGSSIALTGNIITAGSGAGISFGVDNAATATLSLSSGNTFNGGGATTSYGVNNPATAILSGLTNNIFNGDSATTFYGIYNLANNTIPTLSNNVFNGGSGDFYGIYNKPLSGATNSITTVSNNTFNGGTGTNFYGVYNFSLAGVTAVIGTLTFNTFNGGSQTVNSYGISNFNGGSTITTLSNNIIHVGSGATIYGILNSAGGIGTLSNNTITGGSGTGTSYGLSNTGGTIATLSNNTINGGSGATAYGISNTGAINTMSNNTIHAGSGTNSYGVFNSAGSIATFSNNSINGGSGTNSYGVWNNNTITMFSNNTINGGSGAIAYGIYILGVPSPKNNVIFVSGKNNTRFAFYEGNNVTSPANILNNNIFDSGSVGKFYFYADKPGAISTGTTCINAAGGLDTSRNCYSLISDVNNAAVTTGGAATTAQGNVNIDNTAGQLFVNAPLMQDTTKDGVDPNAIYDGATTSIEVGACDLLNARYVLNEFIEYNDDTIARQITGVNCTATTSIISFSPALAAASTAGVQITLWGANGANMIENYRLNAATANTCNALFGGLNLGAGITDFDGITRTANITGLPCTMTAPSSTLGQGWSMGAFERD
ncbi:MAG: hypothetical protein OEV78_02620 [Spirochaetia bacterium]|nr:hypothetical protein [Spirochaetia bacterium]